MYEDKTLVCKECGNEFVFTAGEQEFYAEKGFTNEPQRCKACRQARKNAAKTEREFFETVCAECGGRFLSSLLKAKATIAANVLQKEKQLNN